MKLKRVVFVVTMGILLALCGIPQVQASSLLRIDVSGTALECNNSTVGGVTTCLATGFNTVLNSNVITFTGAVNGVSFGGGGIVGVQLSGNEPGTPAIAFVLDSKTALSNGSGAARTVTVDFGGNNFTQPVGSGFLTASQTANWTTSATGDSQQFTAWERNDNALTVPGAGAGGATAISPDCVSPGGLAQSCAQETLNASASPAAPFFALTGRETITMAAGTIGSYTSTSTLTAQAVPAIPEPSSVLLFGTGMLMLAGRQWRKRKK